MGDPLLLVVRCLAACSSTMMILSPSRAIFRIHKTHDTGFTSIISLVMTLANCHSWLLYGLVTDNIFPIVVTFAIGDAISLIYITIYWRWTTERTYVFKVVSSVVAFLCVTTTYVILGKSGATHQSHDTVKTIVGYIAVGAALVLYSSPLERVLQVLKHKSAVFIPVDMVIAGSTNNVLWITYAALDSNWFILVPNVIFLVVGIFSLVLYLVYHPKRCPYPRQEAAIENADDDRVEIAVSPKEEFAGRRSNSKLFQLESPAFEAVHSPLAPLHT